MVRLVNLCNYPQDLTLKIEKLMTNELQKDKETNVFDKVYRVISQGEQIIRVKIYNSALLFLLTSSMLKHFQVNNNSFMTIKHNRSVHQAVKDFEL